MLSKDKKAVSPMIGYILLIAIIIAMVPITYSFLKSFATQGSVPECPADTSILIQKSFCGAEKITNTNQGDLYYLQKDNVLVYSTGEEVCDSMGGTCVENYFYLHSQDNSWQNAGHKCDIDLFSLDSPPPTTQDFAVSCDIPDDAKSWQTLGVRVKNNGLFDVDGISVKATTIEDQDIATLDLNRYITNQSHYENEVVWSKIESESNPVVSEKQFYFNLTKMNQTEKKDQIYKIEITPVKVVSVEGRSRIAYCTNARVVHEIVNCEA